MAMKGQSQIIQFILFFMIGMAVFFWIGTTFRDRVDVFSGDILEFNRREMNSHFSALAVQGLTQCKQGCENVNFTTRLSNTTAGAFTEFSLNSSHLTVTSRPDNDEFAGEMHNATYGINKIGKVTSNKPIVLSYSKNQNIIELRVLQ